MPFKCPEARKAYGRAYNKAFYEANREVVLEKNREYKAANLEVIREKYREYNAARRAAMSPAERVATGSVDTAVSRSSLDTTNTLYGGAAYLEAVAFTLPFAEERLRLEALTGIPHEIDHIQPICEGGLHVPENLQVIPRHVNRAKGSYWCDEDWLTDEESERLDQEALEFAA